MDLSFTFYHGSGFDEVFANILHIVSAPAEHEEAEAPFLGSAEPHRDLETAAHAQAPDHAISIPGLSQASGNSEKGRTSSASHGRMAIILGPKGVFTSK